MWEFTPESVTAWASLVTAVATVLLVILAMNALDVWKEELRKRNPSELDLPELPRL